MIARLITGGRVLRKEKETFELNERMAMAICFTVVFWQQRRT